MLAAGAGVLTFLLYLPTVAATVTLRNGGGDSGELVRAAWTLGVPHPTGYPLWVLLAHVATLAPVGEPAHRVALLSTLAAAAAVSFAILAANELVEHLPNPTATWSRWLGAGLAGLLLAFSPLFWQQATIPETYAVDSCLVAAGLWLLLRWMRGRSPLWLCAVVLALALANHLVSLALGVAFVAAAIVRRPRPSAGALIAALTALVAITPPLYLLLIWRAQAHPPANWGDPENLQALWSLVTAREYHRFLTSRGPGAMALELARLPGRLRGQFTLIGAVAAVWSLSLVLVRSRRVGIVLCTLLAVDLAIVARDAAPAAPTYLQLSYVVLIIALGAGIALIPGRVGAERLSLRSASIVALTLLAAFLFVRTRSEVDIHADRSLESAARSELAAVPDQGLLLTTGDNPTFALWYVQDVLGYRPDVVIWAANLVADPWYGDEMHRRFPAVIPAHLPLDDRLALDGVVAANASRRAIVSTFLPPTGATEGAWQQDGGVYRRS